ncbi:MAG: hypothetical protein MK137_01625, partial [Rickettsiales bacterium]|nr:hypothetical protein [Rickettsiales bacterium]
GSWVTEIIDCQRIECGQGYYVGDSRVATNFAQCTSKVGEVIEICSIDASSNGEWVLDTSNCVDPLDIPGAGGSDASCESAYDETDGHSIWPETNVGDTAITECEEGFRQTNPSEKPSRECLTDGGGTWSTTITNQCVTYNFDEPYYYDVNLRLWLDASDSSTLDLDGPRVLHWNNKAEDEIITRLSSDRNDSTLMPEYNGSVITFSGGDFLSNAQAPSYGGAYTLFIVADVGDAGPDSYFADINGHYWLNGSSTSITIGRSSGSFNANNTSGLQIYTLVNDESNDMVLYMGNSQIGNANNIGLGDFANNDTILGKSRFTAGYMDNGSIAEVILYDRVLTDDERNSVFDYLDAKW